MYRFFSELKLHPAVAIVDFENAASRIGTIIGIFVFKQRKTFLLLLLLLLLLLIVDTTAAPALYVVGQ